MGEIDTKFYWSYTFPNIHKAIEFQIYGDEDKESGGKIQPYDFSVTLKNEMDHAGITLEFKTPYRFFTLSYYDVRHWNDEEERWYKPGEEMYKYFQDSERSDKNKRKSLESWIDRHDLWKEFEFQFTGRNIEEIVSSLEIDENPYAHIYQTLYNSYKMRL